MKVTVGLALLVLGLCLSVQAQTRRPDLQAICRRQYDRCLSRQNQNGRTNEVTDVFNNRCRGTRNWQNVSRCELTRASCQLTLVGCSTLSCANVRRALASGSGPRTTTRRGGPRTTTRRGGPRTTTRRGGPRTTTRRGGPRTTTRRGGPRTTTRRAGPRTTTRRAGPRTTTRRTRPEGPATRTPRPRTPRPQTPSTRRPRTPAPRTPAPADD